MPTGDELREIHDELLVLLNQFHQLCMENHIKYSLHGGTLLGAVREKGFIPWDDDADISFTREEYEKFKKVIREASTDNEMRFVERNKHNPVLRLERKDKPMVWLDVFVYDSISENKILQKLKIYIMIFLYLMARPKNCPFNKGRRTIFQMILAAVPCAFGKVIPMATKAAMIDWAGKHLLLGNGSYAHRSNDQYSAISIVLPADILRDYIIVPFKNTELMILKHYHEILLSSYGPDYMTPKRLEDAVDGHVYTRKLVGSGGLRED